MHSINQIKNNFQRSANDENNVITLTTAAIQQRYGVKLDQHSLQTFLVDFSGPQEIIFATGKLLVRYNFQMRNNLAQNHLESSEWGNESKLQCLKVPSSNQHLVLLGYSDGLIEIRDTETLGKVQLTRSNLTQGVLSIDLIYDQFDD